MNRLVPLLFALVVSACGSGAEPDPVAEGSQKLCTAHKAHVIIDDLFQQSGEPASWFSVPQVMPTGIDFSKPIASNTANGWCVWVTDTTCSQWVGGFTATGYTIMTGRLQCNDFAQGNFTLDVVYFNGALGITKNGPNDSSVYKGHAELVSW